MAAPAGIHRYLEWRSLRLHKWMKVIALIGVLAEAIAIQSAIIVAAPEQTKFEDLQSAGDVAFSQGKFDEAEKAYLEALNQKNEPPGTALQQAVILNSLSVIYNIEGRYQEALSACQRAMILLQSVPGKTDQLLGGIYGSLGSVHLHLWEYAKAEQYIRQSIAIFERDHENNYLKLIGEYTLLGVELCSQGRCKQAEQSVQHALALCQPDRAGCQKAVVAPHEALAAIYVERHDYRKAEELYKQALEILEKSYGPSNAMLTPTLSNLSSLYVRQRRFKEAEVAGLRVLEIAKKEVSDTNATAKAALAVGQALMRQGRFEAAEPYFKQLLDIREHAQGHETIQYARALQQYARFLREFKRGSEASVIEAHANALLNRAGQKVDISELSKH